MSSPAQASFTFGERQGLVLLAETSAVSACAVVGLLSYIAYSAVSVIRGSSVRWRLGGPAEVYFLNQLCWDLVQAVGGLMNIKWAAAASVQPGPFCSAQGVIKHLFGVGAALSVVLQPDEEEKARKKSLRRSFIVVACLWSAVGLLVAVNTAAVGASRFYGPTGHWCWIRHAYSVQRVAADYAFRWATAISNIAIYAVVFLYLRGYITTSGWKMRVSRKPEAVNVLGPSKEAYGLLFYPLVYVFNVLPLSAVRYSISAHRDVPFGVIVLADVVYLSSGILNVLLFSVTRPFLLPHDLPKHEGVMSDIEPSTKESEALWDGGTSVKDGTFQRLSGAVQSSPVQTVSSFADVRCMDTCYTQAQVSPSHGYLSAANLAANTETTQGADPSYGPSGDPFFKLQASRRTQPIIRKPKMVKDVSIIARETKPVNLQPSFVVVCFFALSASIIASSHCLKAVTTGLSVWGY
ncbi:hypothetical protein EDB89DRAFT_2164381 [Lactarius sanguifluus]|nr:hypothetical protein EDB89DRAFT_2164381 [Lactarius sanguifluus]